jgi:hypothetical protein
MERKLHPLLPDILLSAILATIIAGFITFTRPIETTDFYPIYYGAKVILNGLSPYSEEAKEHLLAVWPPAYDHAAVPVIAYPVPVLILFIPMAVLPGHLASFLWLFAAIFAIFFSLAKKGRSWIPFVICFLPFFQQLRILNVSLLWCGIAMLIISDRLSGITKGLMLGILTFKPQEGLIISMFYLFLNRVDKRVVKGFIASFSILLIGSFLVFPLWIPAWLTAVKQYAPHSFILSTILISWIFLLPRLPAYIRAIGLQVTVFPLNDLYRLLLLIIGWQKMRRPLQLIALCSYLALAYKHYNSAGTILFFHILPFCIAVLIAWRLEDGFDKQS